MRLQVLLSCMNERDHSIIKRSNIQSDAVIVNQCSFDRIDRFEFVNYKNELCKVIFINTSERGLSRSRNMAIKNSNAEICLLADDDELFENDYEETIVNAFIKHKDAGVIAFSLNNGLRSYPSKKGYKKWIGAMRISSVQISFRRDLICSKNIHFDPKMGAGTGNGAGEEIKFLFDVIKHKIRILYIPHIIASINQTGRTPTSWFKGYNNEFFYNKGWSNRRILGYTGALLYAIYYSITKYPKYKMENSFFNALQLQIKGMFRKV